MAFSSVSTLITEKVYAPLGAPTLPVELAIQDVDIHAALVRYYSYVPIKTTKVHQFTVDREYSQNINELMPDYDVDNPSVTNYFYVGVVSFAPRLQTTSTRLNEYLLGTSYVFPNAEPLKQSALNTQWAENVGDPYYEEAFDQGKVRWVVGGSCQLAVTYGLGHTDITKIPMRHVQLMAWLVGQTYYERLLAIRKTGNFSAADFSLDVELLKAVLEDSKTKGQEYLDSIGLFPVTSG